MVRAQAYTLEGVLAAILVVSATVFGLTAIDTQAWQDGGNEETRRLEARADDVLTVAANTNALEESLVCNQGSNPRINGNATVANSTDFERMLNLTFDTRGDQYNLYFSYLNAAGDDRITRLASEESVSSANRPSTGAAVATRTYALTDDMPFRFGDQCKRTSGTIGGTSLYIPDAQDDSRLYNLVEVRLVVW